VCLLISKDAFQEHKFVNLSGQKKSFPIQYSYCQSELKMKALLEKLVKKRETRRNFNGSQKYFLKFKFNADTCLYGSSHHRAGVSADSIPDLPLWLQ